jgi:hypothetical protein
MAALTGQAHPMNQLEMFAPLAPKQPTMPTAETVRPRLLAVLRELKDGSARSWSVAQRRRWAVVFPQMCEWLPEVERAELRGEFQRLAADLDDGDVRA